MPYPKVLMLSEGSIGLSKQTKLDTGKMLLLMKLTLAAHHDLLTELHLSSSDIPQFAQIRTALFQVSSTLLTDLSRLRLLLTTNSKTSGCQPTNGKKHQGKKAKSKS